MSDAAFWGAPQWATAALSILALGAAVLLWNYWRAPAAPAVRTLAAALKFTGLAALVLCLVEPLLSGVRPRPGANLLAVVVDDSQSLQIHDPQTDGPRGAALQRALLVDSDWQTRLGQTFDVRRFAFDQRLRGVKDFNELTFQGDRTALAATLRTLTKRFQRLPLGGILLLTDGNATDDLADGSAWAGLPPVYPVIIGSDEVSPDASVERIAIRQTNFESAPVTLTSELRRTGDALDRFQVEVLDEANQVLETQTAQFAEGADAVAVRFQLQPRRPGVNFFEVRISNGEESDIREATQENNRRQVVVHHGAGPYRILYVSGRPSWDFKFLRRSLEEDDQLRLVGLVRIARREPKFTFRPRGDSGNQLFEGFRRDDADAAERHDEPVLTRLGTEDEDELRDGFPDAADELFMYDALILDDVEAEFFSADQLDLIESFVSRRGGGLLMQSGVESFAEGGYHRTPVGDLLPIYLDRRAASAVDLSDGAYRLALTREGWLQDWVRLRKTEAEDQARLRRMPAFNTLNVVGHLKPGASELARVADAAGKSYPALVAQRYGRGRSAALLVGDLWRWGLRREQVNNDDLAKAWRQMARWLVADVPRRVEAQSEPVDDLGSPAVDIEIRVHDAEYLPLDNANVSIEVAMPDDTHIEVDAEASDEEPGAYVARCWTRTPGAYRAAITVVGPDGAPVGEQETGWVVQPYAGEFRKLHPNRALLERIATETGGEVLQLNELDDWAATVDLREMPMTETYIRPLWHHPLFFGLAAACLIGEWGLRRWHGLP
ncbi:glutamine amidotransferase [Pirellulales bacterium]|nr:glutamine amidotransferase [Pirellulales bacterium]